MFVLLITSYFKVFYYTGQNRSGCKVFKLKSALLYVYSRPLCKINSDYNTWALLSQKIYPFFFFLFCILQLYITKFRYVAVFRTVDIVKERSCAMPLLSPRTTKLWRGYRVCPVRMYVSTYVRTFVRSYVHPL